MNIYCVYLTAYSGNKPPPFYIGSTSVSKIEKGYKGSVLSKKYGTIWNEEIKQNPHLFKTKIISFHKDRKEATLKEHYLQSKLKVVKSEMYINLSVAAKNGFFGMDVSRENNPNYNKKWNEKQRKRASEYMINYYKQNPDKIRIPPPQKLENNPRWQDGKTTYRDKYGNTVFTSKNDSRVINKELLGVGTNVEKSNLTKSKNPNLKKYEFIIIETPSKEIIKLEWNEYNSFMVKHKLNNFISLKSVKGYKLLEAKINPNCKMNPPIKKTKTLQ